MNPSLHLHASRPSSVLERRAGWVVLALAVGFLVLVAVDRIARHGIAGDIARHYGPFGLHPDPGPVYVFLFGLGAVLVLAAILGLTSERGAKGRRTWVIALTTMAVLLAVVAATASEFGGRVVPGLWAVLAWVPTALLVVLTGMRWRQRRRMAFVR